MPAGSCAGLKMPVPLANAGDQLPPTSGIPPKLSNKFCDGSLLHTTKLPFVPALGNGLTDTVTVEVASPQGVTPYTLYV